MKNLLKAILNKKTDISKSNLDTNTKKKNNPIKIWRKITIITTGITSLITLIVKLYEILGRP